ncbi:hypothetical protein ScPMuIL_004589 [Solemya velum]
MVKQAIKIETVRKPVRPLERQRMRPWMLAQLNEGKTPGLSWVKKSEGIFKITWRHAARHGYNARSDADLFQKWALHTGRLNCGDHKKWKANFRCALNSLPDLTERREMGISKGSNAYKVFQFLDEKTRPSKRRRTFSIDEEHDDYQESLRRTCTDSDSDGEGAKEVSNASDLSDSALDLSDSALSDSDNSMEHASSDSETSNGDLPIFEKICPSLACTTVTLPNHFSGSRFTRRQSTSSTDNIDDDVLSTTSSAMTDDEVVQLVLDAELLETQDGETDFSEYSAELWNTPVAQEVTTGEDGTTYIVLTESAHMPVVTVPGTETNHYDITSIVTEMSV